MNSSNFRVRRATLDDISELTALWQTMRLPLPELSKRITEFQVAQSTDGRLLGAIGLQILERQGRVHSEAFVDFALADQLRPPLWDRIHAIASSQGLLRLWTQEQAPFWHHCGLTAASPEALEKLPAAWRGQPGSWLTLKLKDDLDAIIKADKEFALFMAAEKERSVRKLEHGRILKFLATLIAIGVVMLALGAAIYLVQKNPNLLGR
jgi:N-acetylglutamate synthase-like GNAT family acetyltransferase